MLDTLPFLTSIIDLNHSKILKFINIQKIYD
jgi:hypothetical protein